MPEVGKVYIMGVGPGDYRLMTLKAAECIGKADVIVYDRLINSKILKLARKDAELVYVGKMPDHHAVPQEGINDILVKKALEGKVVARVKGGDPFVFGRGGEEALALVEQGIEFEIIPGVTSAVAVPAYAGIPVTHRDFCSSLHIITGHERPGKESSQIDYVNLAKLEGTLVFLMGVKNLGDICENLISHGKSGQTPAAVVERGTTSLQRVVSGTLETISGIVKEAGIGSPAVTVIGKVAGLGEKLRWFSKGSLSGKRILVTRAREQASRLVAIIEENGGEVVEFPTIRVEGLEDNGKFDSALERLEDYKWIAFTSTNGVEHFFKRMRELKKDVRKLSGIRLCAVGEATAAELECFGLQTDYMPPRFSGKELAEGFSGLVQKGERVLLVRSDIAGDDLPEGLGERGVEFDELTVYRTLGALPSNTEEVVSLLEEKEIDYITFTSSSTVKGLAAALGPAAQRLIANAGVACIGPVTAKAAEELGIRVAATADECTVESLVKKLEELAK